MNIFFNGDSHTCGSELYYPKQDTYSYRLSNLLDAEVVGNLSIGGASNDYILNTTEEYLRNCKDFNIYPDLIVIGWSECRRFDWYYEGKYHATGSTELLPEIANKLDSERYLYDKTAMGDPLMVYAMTKYYHNQIYNLHQKLEGMNIPHLFFMGVHSFYETIDIDDSFLPNFFKTENNHRLIHFDWNNRFWNPYDKENGSFLSWGKNKGYLATPYHHLPKEAHLEFAHILRDYLLTNSII